MKTLSRRNFIKATLVSGTAMAAMGLVGCSSSSSSSSSSSESESTESTESASTVEIQDVGSASESTQSEDFIAEEVSIASGDPTTFLPLIPAGGGKCSLNEIYEPLADQDGAAGELYGVLAKDWSWDGNDLNVELYDYIYDTNGEHMTASDIVWYYEEMKANGYDYQKYNQYCTGCETTGDYTMVFHFTDETQDVYQNVNNLFRGACCITQASYEAASDQMANNPVGTGRYQMTAYSSGLSCTLERCDDYWQTDESLIGPQHQANVQTINYYFITDSAQILNALRTGEVDYVEDLASTAMDEFNNDDEYTVYGYYTGRMAQTYFNCLEGAPFNDINLRAALCYAINSEDIVEAVGGEQYCRRLYEMCTPSVTPYNEDCETWDSYYNVCDLDLAKEYLAQASGYEGHDFNIVYQTTEHEEVEEAIGLVIGMAFENLGLKYHLTPSSDIDNVNVPTNSDWDIILCTQGGNGGAPNYYNRWQLTTYEGGMGNWFDDEMNEMYTNFNTNSGATEDNLREFMQYQIENFYTYGTIEIVLYDCWRSSLVADASTKTFRTWTIPGSWTYVE